MKEDRSDKNDEEQTEDGSATERGQHLSLILRADQLLTYFYHIFAISVECWGFGSGGGL